jgi:quinoprotein glucose dehydrogenase
MGREKSAVRRRGPRPGFGHVLGVGIGVIAAITAAANLPHAHAAGSQAPAEGKTVWDAVYSAEQSQRGEEIAKSTCSVCHGDGLAGSDLGPALMGTDFVAAWSGRSLGELYEKIHTTMPADAPGTLKPQQSADLVAHILKLNDFPAGTTELASEMAALNQIRIRSKQQ